MTNTRVSAAAVSGILARHGFKRSASKKSWSPGFEVQGYGTMAEVWYTPKKDEQSHEVLVGMARVLNARYGYRAEVTTADQSNTLIIKVYREVSPEEAANEQAERDRKTDAVEVVVEDSEDIYVHAEKALTALRTRLDAHEARFYTRLTGEGKDMGLEVLHLHWEKILRRAEVRFSEHTGSFWTHLSNESFQGIGAVVDHLLFFLVGE